MAVAQHVKAAAAGAPRVEFLQFRGGLDTETPQVALPPGFVVDAINFEVDLHGGYTRQTGYERFDGRPAPSSAQYGILQVAITGSFSVGDVVTGAVSGATGKVLLVVTSETPNYLVLTKTSGTFQSGETLNVSGVPQGTAQSTLMVEAASDLKKHAQYRNLAADEYRADIQAVPGSGAVLGVYRFNGTTYAFRNNSAGTQALIYRSSSGGWVNVPLGSEVSFTNGSGSVDDGDTLTQGAVSATIKRVAISSGSLSQGTAQGKLIVYNVTGGNFAAGTASTTGGGSVTLSGAQSQIVLSPGGRYEIVSSYFGGKKRMYGCDRVNRGFEFDGTDYGYVPIDTGANPDAPQHVVAHKNYLFFSQGGSVMHSAPGNPHSWSAIDGAAEIATGDDVMGFMIEPGSEGGAALSIISRNRVNVLYGSSAQNWQMVTYRDEIGALEYSIQQLGFTLMLDDRGVISLHTSQRYGNFAHATLTHHIQRWINGRRGLVRASMICRDRSQYRLFFSDQYALYITFAGEKMMGAMPQRFSHDVTCAFSGEDTDGSETMYFGSSNGFVYHLDKGTSFDGDPVEHYLLFPYLHSKNPRQIKHYRKASLDINGEGYAELGFLHTLGYGSPEISQPDASSIVVELSGITQWDEFTWDNFVWDGTNLSPSEVSLTGSGQNVSFYLYGISDYFFPVTLHGVFFHYSPRRALR